MKQTTDYGLLLNPWHWTTYCARADQRIFRRVKNIGILTYANGYHLSLQAAKKLFDEPRNNCRIVDLRWTPRHNAAAVVEAIAPLRLHVNRR